MEVKEFQQKLNELSQKINIQLEEKQINQFYTYMNLLLQWNEKINLTAITDPNEIILKHFIDSITITSYLEKNKNAYDPRKIISSGEFNIKKYIKDKLQLLGNSNRL